MKDMKTHKILCYLSAGLFLIRAGYLLINNVVTWMDYFTLTGFLLGVLNILSSGLVGLGLATEKREFAMFGAGAGVLASVLNLVFIFGSVLEYLNMTAVVGIVVGIIPSIVCWGILAFIAHSGSKKKALPILCAIINVAVALLQMFLGSSLSLLGIAFYVAQPLAGFALIGMEKKPAIRSGAVAQKAAPAAGTGPDKFERLNQLKTLLDMGAISQEEFEQKKKEIINS